MTSDGTRAGCIDGRLHKYEVGKRCAVSSAVSFCGGGLERVRDVQRRGEHSMWAWSSGRRAWRRCIDRKGNGCQDNGVHDRLGVQRPNSPMRPRRVPCNLTGIVSNGVSAPPPQPPWPPLCRAVLAGRAWPGRGRRSAASRRDETSG